MIRKVFYRAAFKVNPLALYKAVENGNIKRVQKFLDAGVNIDAPPYPRYTAKLPMLHIAVFHKNKAMAEFLLSRGANVNATMAGGQTAVWLALKNLDILKLLIEKGADVTQELGDGKWNILHTAVRDSSPEVIKLLIAAGADPNAQNSCNETALHVVAEYSSSERTQALLDGGASRDIKNYRGQTPLDIANEKGRAKTAALLVEYQPPAKVPRNSKKPQR